MEAVDVQHIRKSYSAWLLAEQSQSKGLLVVVRFFEEVRFKPTIYNHL
jgi:hypothetical protein